MTFLMRERRKQGTEFNNFTPKQQSTTTRVFCGMRCRVNFSLLIFNSLLVKSSIAKMSSFTASKALVLDPFGKRQFNNPDYTGTQVAFQPPKPHESIILTKIEFQVFFSEGEFESRVNEYFEAGSPLIDVGDVPLSPFPCF